MRTPFRPDATAFETVKIGSGRSDPAVNLVMCFDLSENIHLNYFFIFYKFLC
jgi:hypothetical protein